ncbi:MAG: DUF4330 family protein [Clostridia bacterium]|nr:DUF4330 family protein [Clostridia bacterium]
MQKKKFRINILDFLIIALVVLCIVGAALRGYIMKGDDKLDGDVAVISFKIENIQAESADCFKDGDTVYWPAYECDFGTLVGDIEYTDAVYYVEDDGQIFELTLDDHSRIDVRGTIECKGNFNKDGSFSLNGNKYIAPGTYAYLYFTSIHANVVITDIQPK